MSTSSDNNFTHKLLVNGNLVAGESLQDVWNPATGEVYQQAPLASLGMLDEAVSAAKASFAIWRSNVDRRRDCMKQMAQRVIENQEALARCLSAEIGVPLKQTMDEIAGAAMFLKYRATSELAVDVIHDDDRQRVEVHRAPIGVVGAIIPWNAPALITCEKVGAAFAAGNTVVVKPSPMAPLTVMALGELWHDLLPAGVLNIVLGDGALGEALTLHPDVGMISFTGSTATGRAIMKSGAATLKRLSLELGGNDAAIVLPDAEVGKVAAKIFGGAFYRSGQVCAAIKRVYVHREIAEEFSAAIAQIAANAKVSDPFDPDAAMGPLSNRQQFDIICGLADVTRCSDAKILAGGDALDRAGYFFAPTIVSDLEKNSPLVTTEQFGPILPIVAYDTVEEAICWANDSEYGLGASIWTADPDNAWELASGLDAGSVWINRHGLVLPDTPFGGMKMSGIGRSNGQVGVDSYCELRTISMAKNKKS